MNWLLVFFRPCILTRFLIGQHRLWARFKWNWPKTSYGMVRYNLTFYFNYDCGLDIYNIFLIIIWYVLHSNYLVTNLWIHPWLVNEQWVRDHPLMMSDVFCLFLTPHPPQIRFCPISAHATISWCPILTVRPSKKRRNLHFFPHFWQKNPICKSANSYCDLVSIFYG